MITKEIRSDCERDKLNLRITDKMLAGEKWFILVTFDNL